MEDEPEVKKMKMKIKEENTDAVANQNQEESAHARDSTVREDDVNNVNEEDSFTFPEDNDVSDMIEKSFSIDSFPTITERYFTPYYQLDVQRPGDDICIRMHSNRICMISLAPSHHIFQNNDKIVKIDFKVSEKVDRTLNKVSGKSKHGAQPLQRESKICFITCGNGEVYTIKCCMIGKLTEINEELIKNPELLRKSPHKGGYLALVLPNLKFSDDICKTFLTYAQYEAAIKERKLNANGKEA